MKTNWIRVECKIKQVVHRGSSLQYHEVLCGLSAKTKRNLAKPRGTVRYSRVEPQCTACIKGEYNGIFIILNHTKQLIFHFTNVQI